MVSRNSSKLPAAMVFLALYVLFFAPGRGFSTGWMDGAWPSRTRIGITNNGGALQDFQVKIQIKNPTTFSANGSDIRFTSGDGQTQIPFWVESWDSSGASVYVKIPQLASGSNSIYMYHGNSAALSVSNGDATFEFFDDFDYSRTVYDFPSFTAPPAAGKFFDLNGAEVVLSASTSWEQNMGGPHSIQVVEANKGGYRWWGYYGGYGNGYIGLVRSNDLIHWDKYSNNAIISRSGIRWPSPAYVNGTFYLVHTEKYGKGSYLVMEKSSDGISFTLLKTIVPSNSAYYNQNAFLFHNPNDNKWYLYWYHGDGTTYHIYVKSADMIENLDTAPSVDILSRNYTIAAPSMVYGNDQYWLAAETLVNGLWAERFYYSESPTGPFTEATNSPMLVDDIACAFQYQFDNKLYTFISKQYSPSKWDTRILATDIQHGLSEKWKYGYGNYDTRNGTLLSNNPVSGYGPRLRAVKNGKDVVFSDGIIEYDSKMTGGYDETGVMFRGKDPESSNTYAFHPSNWIGKNQWWFERMANNNETHLSNTGSYNRNEWYKVKLSISGITQNAEVDGVSVATVQDGTFQSGTFGILSWGNNVGEIDNVRIRKYASAEPTAAVLETESSAAVTVPNVAGKTQADAANLLSAATLTLGSIISQFSSTVSSGMIISQDPAAGTLVAEKTAVNIVLSQGVGVFTPLLVGLTETTAESTITSANLIVGTISLQYSTSVVWNAIISQNPLANTQVATGSAVDLSVSLGIAGDLNHDGVVSDADFRLFMAGYGACKGSSAYVREADYDGDGCIGFNDVKQFCK